MIRRPFLAKCLFCVVSAASPVAPVLRLAATLLTTTLMTASGVWASSNNTAVDTAPTYSEHVAPIFYQHCASCHRPGDVAPMSLLTYQDARPWAKSIRKMVSTREMPPWDADPRYGKFNNDISLSDDEIATVTRWVDAGAPAGDLNLAPAPPQFAVGWKMGEEPDVVVELAAIEVPASGPDLFITQIAGIEVPEGTWVRAVELLPGNTGILHHVVTYLGPFGMSSDEERDDPTAEAGRRFDQSQTIYVNEAGKRKVRLDDRPAIGSVWVAGAPPTEFREGTGQFLKVDQMLSFNMHYHPSGQAGTDASKVGFYFGKGELDKAITTAVALNAGLVIPAGVADHREDAEYLFPQDAYIVSYLPHMHQRGKSMKYTLQYPDDRQEVVLSVPQYDYDWQNIYSLEDPKFVPAGTRLLVEAHWDNSAGNPANPDPSIDVPFGDGTTNEMLVGFVDWIPAEGRDPKAVNANKVIADLLAHHPAKQAYTITFENAGFMPNQGLVLPDPGSSDKSWFYMAFGPFNLSASVRNVVWQGDRVIVNTNMIVSAGGTPAPLSLVATVGADGSILGEAFFGREVTPENLEEALGSGRAFHGRNRSSEQSGS